MASTSRARLYIRLSRPRTVLYSLLAAIGGIFYLGVPTSIDQIYMAVAVLTGVAAAHACANVINDYIDYVTGVDLMTHRTPFSGGTKVIVEGLLKPREALALGIVYLAIAISSGVYLTIARGLLILALILVGALIVLGYSALLVKLGLGELSLFLKGVLIFAGSVYAVTGYIPSSCFLVGAIYGGVSSLRLSMRYIPDRDADRAAGRKTIPVILGSRSWIAFTLIALAIAILVVALPLTGVLSMVSLVALIPAIPEIWAATRVRDARSAEDLIEILRINSQAGEAIEILLTASIVLGSLTKI